MDNTATLAITKREKGSKGAMNQLRRDGFLPASISKKGSESVSFSMRKEEFRKAFSTQGMSGIYTLKGEKKVSFTAMVREIQYVPGSYDYLHVTFQAISLTEETTADIHLHIHGRDALHHNGFELLQQLDSLHVRGLPGDFPPAINIDVTEMEPGAQVTVADVELPAGLTCLTEADRLVLSVSYPKVHEEAPAEVGEAAEGEAAEAAEGGEAAEQSGTESE
ncbi:MAG: 50S ribosomal protein L25 [Clostridiales bacterium]|nr:50S ribosomal protein L25 [Clostridiales bacterium]